MRSLHTTHRHCTACGTLRSARRDNTEADHEEEQGRWRRPESGTEILSGARDPTREGPPRSLFDGWRAAHAASGRRRAGGCACGWVVSAVAREERSCACIRPFGLLRRTYAQGGRVVHYAGRIFPLAYAREDDGELVRRRSTRGTALRRGLRTGISRLRSAPSGGPQASGA
ncbi:hypothetical protein OH77DRAFT_266530 [Trametes cingulata]|nr:hypothetical protein OH77DRAFT_266530 [Trametes cingulata]